MKKLIAILLVAVMVFSFAACGGGSSGSKGTGLWKVTYPDGRIEYYDVFDNGSNLLSVTLVVNKEGSRNILDLFGDNDFSYLAEMGFLGKTPNEIISWYELDYDYFMTEYYSYFEQQATGDFSELFKAEAKRIKENGTAEELDAFLYMVSLWDKDYYLCDKYSKEGELRLSKNSKLVAKIDFDSLQITVPQYNVPISFEGDSKKFTVTQSWNEPFHTNSVWERIGDTKNNASKLDINTLSDLDGIWRIESYDEDGNVSGATYLKIQKSADSDGYITYMQVAPNGSENILEALTGDVETFLIENGYADDFDSAKENWYSSNFTIEESIAWDMEDMLAGKPYQGWSNFEGSDGSGQAFVAPYFKAAAEALKDADIRIQYALTKFYADINEQVEKYDGDGSISGFRGGYNVNSETLIFRVGSDDVNTLSGNSKKLKVVVGYFSSFPAGSVLTRVK